MKNLKSRIISMVLAVVTAASLLPAVNVVSSMAADTVSVYFTMSDQGIIATAKDGSAACGKKITVTDLNGDGSFSCDEALTAAHDTIFEGGAAAGYLCSSGFVTKIWGKETSSCSFYVNGKGISSGVTVDTVSDGDQLCAMIYSDTSYWSDRISVFDKTEISVKENEEITLTLTGGDGYSDNAPLSGIEIGTWNNGSFSSLSAVTDENGQAKISFANEGTYVVTASGSVKGVTAYDYSQYPTVNQVSVDAPIVAPYCIVTVSKNGQDEGDTPSGDNEKKEQEKQDVTTPIDDIYTATANKVASIAEFSYGNEWKVIALARDGKVTADQKQAYVSSVEKKLSSSDGDLGTVTNYERVIIALTAVGADPTNVGGTNLLKKLSAMEDVSVALNSEVFALIALDTKHYEIPTAEDGKTQTTREALINAILDSRLADGGWNTVASLNEADPDITAMAVQALALYYNSNSKVKEAVDTALALLEKSEITSSESWAQIVTAYAALNITDSRMETALNGLKQYYAGNGQFKHILSDEIPDDYQALEQAYYAMVSYKRVVAGKTSLYDMSDGFTPASSNKNNTVAKTGVQTMYIFWIAAFVVLAAAAVAVSRRKIRK